MKILFINTPYKDGLSDVVFNGLLKLGYDVTEYPYKPFYHGFRKDRKICVPEDISGSIVPENSEGTIVLSNNMNSSREFITLSDQKYSLTDLPDILEYDLVIVGFIDDYTAKAIDLLEGNRTIPIIFLDGGDHPFIFKYINKVDTYFKREKFKGIGHTILKFKNMGNLGFEYLLKLNRKAGISVYDSLSNVFLPSALSDRVRSLNLSINDHDYPKYNGDKIYDISLVASPNTPYRVTFSSMLQKFAEKQNLKIFCNLGSKKSSFTKIPWPEYVRVVQQSKLSISLPGMGFDTFRYWEIPYYGSVLVSPKLPIEIENNFEDMKSGVFFDKFAEFQNKTLKVLRSDSWEEISKNGHSFFLKHHSSEERAKKTIKIELDNRDFPKL
ncbi:MAG: glycosyltransferase [Thermodesulfobium sp.]